MKIAHKSFFAYLALLIFSSQIVSASPLDQVTFECVRSFENYAYGLREYETSNDDELDDQWLLRYEIPRITINGLEVPYNNSEVLFSRINNSQQEIWIQLDLRSRGADLEYGVYNATTDEFRRVSASIGNLNLVATQLFVDFNGTVWGITAQSAADNIFNQPDSGYFPNVSEFFVLAYFDEAEQQFTLATGEPRVNVRKEERRFIPDIQVVADHNLQIFWLFSETGIYRYDPQAQNSTLVHSFSGDGVVTSVDIALSGQIYFSRVIFPSEFQSTEFSFPFTHNEGSLFVLTPETNLVNSIDSPPQTIPDEPNLFVDRQQNLWLGPTAYRDGQTGLWEIVHPDLNFALDASNFIMFGWGYPKTVLADSEGRIWFGAINEPLDGATGLAWYDPATGHGCNNILGSTNIIEDADGNLWFFDIGARTLYQTVDSITPINLSLTPICSLNPETIREWQVSNPNTTPVNFTWEVSGTTQMGSGTVPGGSEENPGMVTFETAAVAP